MLSRARQQLVPLTGKGRGDSVDAQQAVSMAESMHEMNRELLGIEADEAQQSALVLGHAYDRAGRLADGERVYREMLDITLRQADRKRDHAYMRYTLGGNLRRQGAPRAAEARKLLKQAIADWGTLDKPPFARCEALLELAFVAGIEAKYDEQRALLAKLCTEVARRRMTGPALTFLEMSRPLNTLGAAAMHFFTPLASTLANPVALRQFAEFLDQRGSVDVLCQMLETAEKEHVAGSGGV
jgi:tetratricopeptide (TPR) repeat protein